MMTASLRAYYDGPDTLKRREEIVTAYLNSTPLASMPGYGEIIGLPDALWVWFGTDLAKPAKVLNKTPRTAAELARQGEVYRQVLAFVVSGRRPSYYLLDDRAALGVLIDNHLYALASAGIISPALRDAALNAELHFRTEPPPIAAAVSYVQRKSTEEVRNRLVGLLHLPDLYALDRLDLTVETSVDTDTQARVANVMERLSDPAFLRSAGMYGHGLLNGADPSKIAWSFVLYERGDGPQPRAGARRQPEPAVRHQLGLETAARLDREAAHPGHLSADHRRAASAARRTCRPPTCRVWRHRPTTR